MKNASKGEYQHREKWDNRYLPYYEIRNYSERLERHFILSLLGEIECYPHRVRETNIIILIS